MVRFKGATGNEIIDWPTAKEYPNDFMEFFASRTIWTDMHNIVDPEMFEGANSQQQNSDSDDEMPTTSQQSNEANARNRLAALTSQLDACPNEIEFDK